MLQLQAVHDHYLSCTSQLVHERSDLKSQLSTNLHVAALGMQRSLERSRIVANGLVQKMQRNLHNLTDAFVAMTREWMVNVLRPFQVAVITMQTHQVGAHILQDCPVLHLLCFLTMLARRSEISKLAGSRC